MTNVENKVLTTVNAPYGAGLSAHQLANLIIDPASADAFDASAFSFFSDVKPALQRAFVEDMGLDGYAVHHVASVFSRKCGYGLALAA